MRYHYFVIDCTSTHLAELIKIDGISEAKLGINKLYAIAEKDISDILNRLGYFFKVHTEESFISEVMESKRELENKIQGIDKLIKNYTH